MTGQDKDGTARRATNSKKNDETARRAFETKRKRELAVQTLDALCQSKGTQKLWGKVIIEINFQKGYIKSMSVTDTTTVQDRPLDDLPPEFLVSG